MDLGKHLSTAIEIAEGASQIALSYFRKAILIETKADSSPVTIADKNSEEFIRERIHQHFPGHGIIGEEFGLESDDAEFVWTVDPIDGTRSFVRGIPLWGTLLGLLHKNEPVLGVMVMPGLQETYAAARDLGAQCNGERIHVSGTAQLKGAFVAYGDTMAFEKAKKKPFLKRLQTQTGLARSYADCFGHSLVLRGAVDAMVDPVVAPWDVIPIACLVEEAGGEYFGFKSEEAPDGESFISCNSQLQEAILDLE